MFYVSFHALIVEPMLQTKPRPAKVIDDKRLTVVSDKENGEEQATGDSSPNNSISDSSFQMDFASIFKSGTSFHSRKRDLEEFVDVQKVLVQEDVV